MAIDAALTELSHFLGNRLGRSKADRDAHGQSEAYFSPAPPDGVVYPENTAEVSRIVEICSANDCPVIGWGAGTSLEGHALAIRGGVCVDFRLMNNILAINAEDMDVVVQPGITRQDLNRELRASGLFFPIDPGANASIGGMAATRASGTTAVRYGTMRDNVLGAEVVLADGRIIRTGSRARKSSAGYDLTALMVGSEGTLGLMTEITLRLRGQPDAISAAVCAFATITDAVNAVITTIQMGIPMARIEFIDEASVLAVNSYDKTDFDPLPHLMIEFHGSERGVAEDAERFGEIAAEFGSSAFRWSAKTEERSALWAMRHSAYYACLALRPGASAVVTDICVPVSQLAQAVQETTADIAASPLQGPILGHVGDGNFHAILLVMPDDPQEMAEARRLAASMSERALRLGGTITGEHGVGIGKLDYMAGEHGEAWSLMSDIKRTLDPKNIMNPGKLVRIN
jgi:D-lactate dehydrogenase (cytochrome)